MKAKPVLKYPGAKWRIASWIVSHLPPHTAYLEPYFGSGAVLFNKPPSKVETVNDINGRVVNLFRVLREQPEALARQIDLTPWARDEYYASCHQADDPLEDARRFLVRCWQAFGGRLDARSGWRHEKKGVMRASTYHTWVKLGPRITAAAERLRHVQIENRPAIDLIRGHNYPGTLIYADPPYPLATRNYNRYYPQEMTDAEHTEMLNALDAHSGPVLLSGYSCPLYDERLHHWTKRVRATNIEGGQKREEVLWLNPMAAKSLPLANGGVFIGTETAKFGH